MSFWLWRKSSLMGVSIIKYQQPDEDLYALVSIVNEEEAMNMMEEYYKHISVGDGPTWLKIFLFSQNNIDPDSTTIGMHYDAEDGGGELSRGTSIPSTSSERYMGHLSIDGGIPNCSRHFNVPSHRQREMGKWILLKHHIIISKTTCC